MIRKHVQTVVRSVLLSVAMIGLMVSPVVGEPPPRVKVLIGFRSLPGPAEEALVRGLGGTVEYAYHLVPAIAASVPEAAIEGLLRSRIVTGVDLDGQVRALDAELDNAWGVKWIGAGEVHASNAGAGVKVAIIDSGINYGHPDLDANYVVGYDFVNDDGNPMDDYGHGTHVAGTVAAEDNGFGVVGVAPEASIYALKVLDSGGYGSWSDIVAAVQWCVDNGMHVANLSLGTSRDPGGIVQAAFDTAEAAGVVIVAAAGNDGNPPGKGNSVDYPGAYDSVIAVAATDSVDNRASWSSTGDQVELAAPGVSVLSTWDDRDSSSAPQPICVDGVCYYKYGSGTSMAAPHVAGTAALVIASGITDANGNGRINDEVRSQLQETADDIGAPGRDPQYGFGLVDAVEATQAVNAAPVVSIASPTDGATFDSGATVLFAGTASDAEDGDLTGSLIWNSSIDGQIGIGGSFSTTLSDGSHIITAAVTDSGGKAGSDSVGVTIGSGPSEPTEVSVTSITYSGEGGRNKDKHLKVVVALVDDLGGLTIGASVSVVIDNTTIGQSWASAATSGEAGTVEFAVNNAPAGCYSTTVTEVVAAGLTWDGTTPDNEFCK
jgi:hypothetical protein